MRIQRTDLKHRYKWLHLEGLYSPLPRKSAKHNVDSDPPFTWLRETGLARSHGHLNQVLNRFKIAKTVSKPVYWPAILGAGLALKCI